MEGVPPQRAGQIVEGGVRCLVTARARIQAAAVANTVTHARLLLRHATDAPSKERRDSMYVLDTVITALICLDHETVFLMAAA